jgi:AmmeMemoRadiSam system protein B
MSDAYPKLRAVEAFPVEHDGRKFVGLRDPAGYTSSILLLPVEAIEVVSRFDGQHSVTDIQALLTRRTGELVFRDTIDRVIEMLDEHGFLDSERFAERKRGVEQEFRDAPYRLAAHAGGAYPEDPDALRAALDRFFEPPAGPGAIEWPSAATPGDSQPVDTSRGRGAPRIPRGAPSAGGVAGIDDPPMTVDAIVAPHIDFHRGGPAYAWAYRDVAERCPADVFVVFGTCHAGMADPFAITRKDYDTPLGPARVDQDFVDGLVARSAIDLFASELAHRSEHSIEFQAVCLRHLFGDRRPFTIVPILASFAHEAMLRGSVPEDDPNVRRVLDAVVQTAAASGRRVAFVAGADLAHVGPRFGDPSPLTPADMARVASEDRDMLRAVEEGDPKAFFASVATDGDRRRICGLSPIWSVLYVLGGRQGAVRYYGQTPDPSCVVTFASVVFP